jgi:hypothetical protein
MVAVFSSTWPIERVGSCVCTPVALHDTSIANRVGVRVGDRDIVQQLSCVGQPCDALIVAG